MRKLLVIELWGLGDLTIATAFLREAVQSSEVHLLAKPHAAALLRESYPTIHFIELDAPWTAFKGKYRLWRWPWKRLWATMGLLAKSKYDVAVSVRKDPRDHFLMWCARAKKRIGFGTRYSRALLTERIERQGPPEHRVRDWWLIGDRLGFEHAAPELKWTRAQGAQGPAQVVLHTGARIAVRRWPEASFATIIKRLRDQFDFFLTLIPDPDGYGAALAPLADRVISRMSIPELVDLLGGADVLICNDSGPMHIAAALGTPTLAFFGPTDSRVFGPWGTDHKIIERDLCIYRPCFDYCHFDENYCLTRLLPDAVWPEISNQLLDWVHLGVIPANFHRATESPR